MCLFICADTRCGDASSIESYASLRAKERKRDEILFKNNTKRQQVEARILSELQELFVLEREALKAAQAARADLLQKIAMLSASFD